MTAGGRRHGGSLAAMSEAVMKRATFVRIVVALLATGTAARHHALAAGVIGAGETPSIGTVRLTHPLMADGRLLPAGTYQVRLTGDQPAAAAGQSPGGERWVEFVKSGTVAGREVATVISDEDVKTIVKGTGPKANASRVDLLKGGDYVRVWINHGGTNYIINMPPAP